MVNPESSRGGAATGGIRWGIRVRRRHEPLQPTPAPGAIESPQMPGEVPDWSTIPGARVRRLARPARIARPLIELGTAQGIMRVFSAPPGAENEPTRFEQATASYEELRKAYPVQLPPAQPAPGYALAAGNAMASERQELDWPTPALAPPSLPADTASPAGAPPAAGGDTQPRAAGGQGTADAPQ